MFECVETWGWTCVATSVIFSSILARQMYRNVALRSEKETVIFHTFRKKGPFVA